MLGDCGSLDASSNLAPGPRVRPSPELNRSGNRSASPQILIAPAEWALPHLEAMKKLRGARIPRERGCDDQAGGEDVRSCRAGATGPELLDAREGLPEDRGGTGERRRLLLRRRTALHDRLDPPRPGPEQDDQGSRGPLPPDAGLSCPRPAGLRHARPPDRGPGRESPRDHE